MGFTLLLILMGLLGLVVVVGITYGNLRYIPRSGRRPVERSFQVVYFLFLILIPAHFIYSLAQLQKDAGPGWGGLGEGIFVIFPILFLNGIFFVGVIIALACSFFKIALGTNWVGGNIVVLATVLMRDEFANVGLGILPFILFNWVYFEYVQENKRRP